MTVDQFLQFFMDYNHLIIQGLTTVVLLLLLYLGYRAFFAQSAPGAETEKGERASNARSDDSRSVPQGGAGSSANSEQASSLQAQLTTLQVQLQQRDQAIASLNASVESAKKQASEATAAAATAAAGGNPDEALLKKIEELEGKLSEYEIIEDDIADLSHYKSEVARLQALLDQAGSAAPAAAEPPAPVVAAPELETPAEPEATPEAEPIAEPEPALEPEPEPEPAPEPEATAPVEPEPVAMPEAPATAPPVEAAPVTGEAAAGGAELVPEEPIDTEIDAELMAEFATALGDKKKDEAPDGTATAEADSPLAGDVDIEKMTSEAMDIQAGGDDSGEEVNALESEIDPEKLAEEAFAMGKVGNEPNDNDLMNEFEDFVNKGNKDE